MKQTQKNKTKRQKSETGEFGRISSTLLPSAAIITAVPKSPHQIKLNRSPSPLTRAVASFTKVGQAIIGDTTPRRKSSSVRLCHNVTDEEYSVPYDALDKERGRSKVKKSMKNRPAIPIPENVKEPVKQQGNVFDLYATIDKEKHHQNELDDSQDGYISDDVITNVSDENNLNGYCTVPLQSISALSTKKEQKIIVCNTKQKTDAYHPPQDENIAAGREDIIVQENIIVPEEDTAMHAVDSSTDDNLISEGQVLTLGKFSPEAISNSQKIYLSTESLEHEYLLYAGQDIQDGRVRVTSPLMLQNSLNSSLSASNFITSEKLIDRLQKRKALIHSQTDLEAYQEIEEEQFQIEDIHSLDKQLSKYRTKQDADYSKKAKHMENKENVLHSSSKHIQRNAYESPHLVRANVEDMESRNIGAVGDTSTIESESRLPENYLHISPKRNSLSSSQQSAPYRRNKYNQSYPLSKQQKLSSLNPAEIDLRNSLNAQLQQSINTLDLLLSAVKSPKQKEEGKERISLLFQIAAENRQRMDDLNDIVSNELAHPDDIATTQVLQLDADRKILQDLNQTLVAENNALRMIASSSKEKDYNVENEHLIRQVNILKDENSRFKETLSNLKDRPHDPDCLLHKFDQKSEESHLLHVLHKYDEKLKAKSQLIKTYEERLSFFEMQQKNKEAMNTSFFSMDEWNQLKEQSKLVLEENQLLVEQKILYKKTIDDLTQEYQQQVTKLSKDLLNQSQEKKSFENLLSERHLEIAQLRNKNDKLVKMMNERMDVDDYEYQISKINREHHNEINKLQTEKIDLIAKLDAVIREKDRLAIQVTDLTAVVSGLKLELDITENNFRKSEKRLTHSLKHLDTVCGKEMNIKETLSQVVKLAEKSATERDELAKQIQHEKEKTKDVMNQLQDGDFKIHNLHNKLKKEKARTKEKISDVNERLYNQNKELASLMKGYERELEDLRDIVRQKQKFIDRVQSNRRLTDAQIEDVWRSLRYES